MGLGSFLSRTARTIDRNAKRTVDKVKAVPVAGGVVRTGQRVLEGPIGTTVHKVLKNPVVQTAFGPYTIPYQLALAASTGGVQGAAEDAKAALRNPVRRAAAKAVAIVFPPAIPAVAALESANKALDAVESDDPATMAKAAAQIGASYALSEEGNADAQRAIEFFDQARRARQGGTSVDVMKLADLWLADPVARDMLEKKGLGAVRPARVRDALITLNQIAEFSPAALQAMPAAQRASVQAKGKASLDLVAAVLEAGAAHADSPYFVHLAKAVQKDVAALDKKPGASTQTVLAGLEQKVMLKGLARTLQVNKLVRAHASGDPKVRAHMSKITTAAKNGNAAAIAARNEAHRRAAALGKASEYRLDASGMVRHVGRRRR